MVDAYGDDSEEEGKLSLEKGAAPDPVAVYDRPASADRPSATSLIITVVVLLLLLVVAYFALQTLLV